MEILKYIALVLAILVVQHSCRHISRRDERDNHGLETTTREYSNDDESIGALFGKLNDKHYIASLFERLGVNDAEDHIANLKLLLEEDYEREEFSLKEQDYDNKRLNCWTDSILESRLNLKGNKKSCAIEIGNIFRSTILEEKTIERIIEDLREKLPKSPKIWRLKERLDEIYRKISYLIKRERQYNYNLLIFYSTLFQTIKENVGVLSRVTIEGSIKRFERLLRLPVIRYYLRRLTGISDLTEGYISNLYKELKMKLTENNESNRKLRKEYKEYINNFIKVIIVDIEQNYFPLSTIYFLLDQIEDYIPLIENINRQSRAKVRRNAELSNSQKAFDKALTTGEFSDFELEQIRRAQEELRQIIVELTDMAIDGLIRLFDGKEERR